VFSERNGMDVTGKDDCLDEPFAGHSQAILKYLKPVSSKKKMASKKRIKKVRNQLRKSPKFNNSLISNHYLMNSSEFLIAILLKWLKRMEDRSESFSSHFQHF